MSFRASLKARPAWLAGGSMAYVIDLGPDDPPAKTIDVTPNHPSEDDRQ
jgi:hypothetical protein